MYRNAYVPPGVLRDLGEATASKIHYGKKRSQDSHMKAQLPAECPSSQNVMHTGNQNNVSSSPISNKINASLKAPRSPLDAGVVARQEEEAYDAGAIIDVSPNGSWLAWFKTRPRPSPNNCAKRNSTQRQPASNADSRFVSSVFKVGSSPASANSAMEKELETKTAEAGCSYETDTPNGSQETMTSVCTTQLPGSRQESLEEIKGNTKSGSELSRKVKACAWVRIKHHRRAIGVVCILLFAFSIAMLLFTFLWIIPHLIQSTIDTAEFVIQRAVLTNPQVNNFHLETSSLIRRLRGETVTLQPFESNVFYIPKDYSILSKQTRILQDATDAFEKSQSQTTLGNLSGLFPPPLLRKNEDLTKTSLEILNSEIRLLLGKMHIPECTLKGKVPALTYNTTFEIFSHPVFDTFLREFLTTGKAQWSLEGTPAVTLLGFTYKNMKLHKVVKLEGPELGYTIEKFTQRLDANNITNNAFGRNKHAKVINRANIEDNGFRISLFDMTQQINEDGVKVIVHAEFTNKKGTAVIDPIGYISVAELYDEEPIIQLSSTHNVSLYPGVNTYKLEGIIPKLKNLNVNQRKAFTKLLSTIFRGQAPTLETRGLTCSTPLYAAGVDAIQLYTSFNLFQSTTFSNASLDSAVNFNTPLIQSMKILEMNLSPGININNQLRIHGISRISVANPFGPQGLIEIPSVKLSGAIASIKGPTATKIDDGRKNDQDITQQIGAFYGTLKGQGKTYNPKAYENPLTLSRHFDITYIGPMAVSIQELDVYYEIQIDIKNDRSQFTQFVKKILQNSSVILSLFNVTASVKANSPLGLIEMDNVPINKDIPLQGFQGLQDIKLIGFELGSIGLASSPLTKLSNNGLDIVVSVLIPSTAAMYMYLGTLTVELSYKQEHLVYLSALNCEIKPGDNVFNFTGTIELKDMSISKIIPIITNYIAGKTSVVEAKFVRTSDVIGNDDIQRYQNTTPVPYWIEDALMGIQMPVPLPGLSKNDTSLPLPPPRQIWKK